jgi:hypothetical protein
MSTRRRKTPQGSQKVIGFRLDESTEQKLIEMANRFATTPSKYARAVLTTHLLEDRASPADTLTAESLDELGAFLRQIRDDLLLDAERQGKRLDSVAVKLNAVAAHLNALTKQVVEVDKRLANFLAGVTRD